MLLVKCSMHWQAELLKGSLEMGVRHCTAQGQLREASSSWSGASACLQQRYVLPAGWQLVHAYLPAKKGP